MCCTTKIGGMGAVRSGRIWLSAWGPPVEIPITRQIRENGEVDGLVVDGSAGLSGRSAVAGLGRGGELRVIATFPDRVVGELPVDVEGDVVRRIRRTRLWAAVKTLATSRSELARISASWFRSGLGMKSTAPSSSA